MNARLGTVGKRRGLVLLVGAGTTAAKLRLAATTAGTHDILQWAIFSQAVRKFGPIGIYATRLSEPFNHPPLIGWFLVAVNAISVHGPSARFLIRFPASVADLVTAVLVFELVRRSHALREATVAALIVAASPVLIVISGFHGNTDPVFVMFILLSVYLVVIDRPISSGVSAALAISIKLVPVVALPTIAVALLRYPRRLRAALAGFLGVLLPLWGPVILRQWRGFKVNVLDYKGLNPTDTRWGIVDVARHLHSVGLENALVGPGRFVALAVSALGPAYLVLRRRDTAAAGVGLSLASFLLLTTTFGTQYLAWAAAGVLLLDVLGGLAFNVVAGIFLIVTYTAWTGGFPWYQGLGKVLTPSQERLGWLAWVALLIPILGGVRKLWRWPVGSVGSSAEHRARQPGGLLVSQTPHRPVSETPGVTRAIRRGVPAARRDQECPRLGRTPPGGGQ